LGMRRKRKKASSHKRVVKKGRRERCRNCARTS
jgi:hypothetical protein